MIQYEKLQLSFFGYIAWRSEKKCWTRYLQEYSVRLGICRYNLFWKPSLLQRECWECR